MKTDGVECLNTECDFHSEDMSFSCSRSDNEPNLNGCKDAIIADDQGGHPCVINVDRADGRDLTGIALYRQDDMMLLKVETFDHRSAILNLSRAEPVSEVGVKTKNIFLQWAEEQLSKGVK